MSKADHFSHDGCHITDYKKYFEWWYFDFDLTSKHHIYLEWHAPNFTLLDTNCLLIVRVHHTTNKHSNDQKIKVFRYDRSKISQDETFCKIILPTGIISERDNNYYINIQERGLLINIELERLLPRVSVENELLYRSKNGREFFSWNIPLPRAKVTGEIEISGERIDMQGTAYHDHNWGNLNIGKHICGWIWARIQFQDYTLIFGDITAKESSNQNIQVLLLIDKYGQKIDTTSFSIDCLDHQNLRNSSIPHRIIISINSDKRYTIHLQAKELLTNQEFPVGSFDNPKLNSFLAKAYYLFKVNYAPNYIKRLFGGSLYFQFIAGGELYIEDRLIESKEGKMEIFSFANI